MKYLIIGLVIYASLFSINQAQDQNFVMQKFMHENSVQQEVSKEYTLEENVHWYMSLLRGAWAGFFEGLYSVQEAMISDQCLSRAIGDKIIRIITTAKNGENIVGVLQQILDGAAVINNLNECDIEQVLFDITKFCNADKKNCDGGTIIQNAQNKIFQIIDKINQIASTYMDFPSMTDD